MSSGHSPVEQFAIKNIFEINLFGLDLSFTNSAAAMGLALGVITLIMHLGTRRAAAVPGYFQIIAEGFYNFIGKLVSSNIHSTHQQRKYIPLVFSIFTFIMFCNLIGLIPYSFTPTSHLAVTLGLSSIVFVCVVLIGIAKNGFGFFGVFIPAGTPWWLKPAMLVIEFFSYLIRPITLAVRLSANMIAGHTVLKVIAGFVLAMKVFGILPILFTSALIGFEVFVALLQAYIFTLLSCIYISEAISH